MPKFNIIQENQAKYKQDIFNFWEEYLPGTPTARLDWMKNNPAGPTIWLFALEENTGALAGTISLFPKYLIQNGKRMRVAILGDLMVHKKFRVFGPYMSLIKTAIAYAEKHEFDFIYTIPNFKSKKLVEKSGFFPLGNCSLLMCPQQCDYVLEKYVGPFLANKLEKPFLSILNLFSRTTYVRSSGIVKKINWDDDAPDNFFHNLKGLRINQVSSDYSITYLDWRYRQNPRLDFQIYTYQSHDETDITGLFVFAINNFRLELYDIVALNYKTYVAIIKIIISICKKAKCRGIYILLYKNNPLFSILTKHGFYDTKDHVDIYVYPDKLRDFDQWYFTSADRNI